MSVSICGWSPFSSGVSLSVLLEETRKLVQSTLKASTERQASNQPPRQTQKTPSIADARVAIHDYVENSHFHPHLIEVGLHSKPSLVQPSMPCSISACQTVLHFAFQDDVRCLTRLVNSQPFPDTLQNPSVCLSFNLSAPLWKLGDDDTVESQTKNKKAE